MRVNHAARIAHDYNGNRFDKLQSITLADLPAEALTGLTLDALKEERKA